MQAGMSSQQYGHYYVGDKCTCDPNSRKDARYNNAGAQSQDLWARRSIGHFTRASPQTVCWWVKEVRGMTDHQPPFTNRRDNSTGHETHSRRWGWCSPGTQSPIPAW